MCTWIAPPGQLKLKNAEIHLWRVDLDRNTSAFPVLKPILSLEERRKADRFRLDLDHRRYILARGTLRTILARYLKTEPGELVFRCGPKGKPELASHAVHFNASHSHGLALYAISRMRDVGVDVERVRAGIDEDVARAFFSLRALRFLGALPQPMRRRAFYQGWTRMEAYSKACGEGLTLGPESLEVFTEPRLSMPLLMPDDLVEETSEVLCQGENTQFPHNFFTRQPQPAGLQLSCQPSEEAALQ
jgi:4'-phosphopantetheinyl transferase